MSQLMNEIKRLKYNRSDNEKQIYKLKALIKEKDKELNELRPIKNDKYYKYNLNEINELKHENKELFKKINTYKSQMKKVESNNRKIIHKLNSFNKGRKSIYNTSSNLLGNRVLKINNPHNLYTISNLNNSFDEIGFKSLNKNTLNQINNIFNYQNKTINNSSCFSPMKTISCKKLNDTNNNASQNSNINNNNKNNRNSIISNIRLLLKEINEMLNIYNSSLDKLQIGNCLNSNNKNNNKKDTDNQIQVFIEENNMTFISKEFINKMDEIIKKMESYLDIEEDETNKNNNNINNIDYSNEIKIEIINIYNVILSTYNDLERPGEDIISFSQLLVKNLVSNLGKEQNDFIIKVKKSLSLLIGLYKNIFKSEKIINHPIRTIYKEVLNYIIKDILYNEVKDDSKKETDNYYQYLLSIYNVLSKDKNESCLTDIQDCILCNSKQLIYENVDSTEFKNPLDLKKNNGLNDIDNRILFHPYLINILSFLDEEYAKAFLGFYIRFFVASEKNELFCCKENIIKCLNYFIKIKWLPEEYVELVAIIDNKNTTFDKIKKIIEFVFLYLRTYKLAPENSSKDIESKKKACEKLKYLYKNIILENINVLE